MKAPIPNRLLVEDFQDAPSWLGRIFSVFNRFQEQTVAVLDGSVSFGENILARRFSTSYTTSGTYTAGDFDSVAFSWTSTELPVALLLTKVQHADGTAFLGSVGTPQWVYSSGNIVISYIPGLANSTKYNFTFLAF